MKKIKTKQKIKCASLVLAMLLLSLSAVRLSLAELMCEFDFFIDKNDNVQFIKSHSYMGNPESTHLSGSDYGLVFFDSSDNLVEKINLPVVFYFLDANENADIIPISERAPCKPEWSEIKIFRQNKNLFSSSVKDIICNNDGKCNHYENVLTCSSDCPSGSRDGWCDRISDSVCDPDCIENDPDCNAKKPLTMSSINKTLPVYCNRNYVCDIYENEINCPSDCTQKPANSVYFKKTVYPIENRGTGTLNMELFLLLLFLVFISLFYVLRNKLKP